MIARPSPAMTSAARGWPLPRCTSRPPASKNTTVGVDSTDHERVRLRLSSASISITSIPDTSISATTRAIVRRVARHGWQKALENCRTVAVLPNAAPSGSRRSIARYPIGIAAAHFPMRSIVCGSTVDSACEKPGTTTISAFGFCDSKAARSSTRTCSMGK